MNPENAAMREEIKRELDAIARVEAEMLAASRGDYWVRWGYHDTGTKTEGPFSEAEKDDLVRRLRMGPSIPNTLVVLRAVEVYE